MVIVLEAAPPGVEEVLRALGSPSARPGLGEVVGVATRRAVGLAVPRAVTRPAARRVALGRALPAGLAESRGLEAAVVTLGPALEDEVRRLFREERVAEGLSLDAAGNVLLAGATREVCRRRDGVWLAPGCHALPLSLVPVIAAAAGSGEVGVEVLASGMLKPEKSVAGLVARVSGGRPTTCIRCDSPVCPWSGRR